MLIQTDTIAAIATALSDSGISIIRISGERSIEIADSIIISKSGKSFLKSAKSHTISYGYVVENENDSCMNQGEQGSKRIIDEVMISVFRAPKSYTREDVVEINCHGGILVTKKN